MNSETPYWVAFNHIHGVGAVRTAAILNTFGSLREAWTASREELFRCGIPERTVNAIVTFRSSHDPEEMTARILARKIHIITSEDSDYPPMLRAMDNYPPLLYYVGRLPSADEKLFAIVGTRRMTSYGESVARELSLFLAENGVGVVSGLARGVDGTAHQAALDGNGRTYGVLGSGVDRIYPPEHRQLARAMVLNGGAVISEFAPGTHPDRTNFPQRNRIISGMAHGLIVIEAGEKSGSLITARMAAQQGREVFCVPGQLGAVQSKGTNRLIRDGARPLIEKEELMEFLGSEFIHHPVRDVKPLQLRFDTPEDQRIVEAVSREPLHIDEISRQTGIPVSKVSSSVILLELKGFIKETAPQTYVRCNDLL